MQCMCQCHGADMGRCLLRRDRSAFDSVMHPSQAIGETNGFFRALKTFAYFLSIQITDQARQNA